MRKQNKNPGYGKLPFLIGIPAVLLVLGLRIAFYYMKSDGFSGISVLLPLLLIGFILFWGTASGFFAVWVYQDCRKRGEDGLLWALVVFIATPLIGMLVYFLRRPELKRGCPACGHLVSLQAKYCEECGTYIENKEDMLRMGKQRTHHLKHLIAGMVSLVLMITCLTGFVVSAAIDGNVNTSVKSDEKIWNFGTISMNSNRYLDGVWNLDFRSASDGFVSEEKFTIKDAETQSLYAEISCETVPEGASLTLWLVQGETIKSIDVTDLSEPLVYSLAEFENGTVRVRLQINGVEDTVSEIYVK